MAQHSWSWTYWLMTTEFMGPQLCQDHVSSGMIENLIRNPDIKIILNILWCTPDMWMGLNNDFIFNTGEIWFQYKFQNMLCSICDYDKFLSCVVFVIMMTKSNINIYCTYYNLYTVLSPINAPSLISAAPNVSRSKIGENHRLFLPAISWHSRIYGAIVASILSKWGILLYALWLQSLKWRIYRIILN